MIAISDLVAFGLVLHSTNINEVNRLDQDLRWKSLNNGASILFLVIYAIILFTTIMPSPNINQSSLVGTTIVLSLVSFALSFTVFIRSKASQEDRV